MSLPIHFVTICLDGMPFVAWHYPVFRQLSLDWHWHCIEGVALPEKDTKWVKQITPRLSKDGSSQHLIELANLDKRVTHYPAPKWPGKTAMFNHALERIEDEEFLLWQVDSDEVWTLRQVREVWNRFQACPEINSLRFHCRYFVGPDIVITSRNTYGNNDAYEWHRVWRVRRGVRFETHEPPKLEGFEERAMTQQETERAGLVFDHFAYATEAQVAFKQDYYGSSNNAAGALYRDAVKGWRRLQVNQAWPVSQLRDFLPWVGENVTAERIKL